MVDHDTNICRSITMDFQPWKDYFGLSSLIQEMACMITTKEQPKNSLLLYPFEPIEGWANRENATNYDCPTFLTPFEDGYSVSSTPLDSYYQDGVHSPDNLNPKNYLAYYQYQSKTPDNFHTEPDAQYKSPEVDPALSPMKREARSRNVMCHFCKHNGESRHVYTGHNLKDEQGKVICPILRMYTCSMCGATGESSHTRKYCPLNKNNNAPRRKTERNSAGHGFKH